MYKNRLQQLMWYGGRVLAELVLEQAVGEKKRT